MPFPLGFILILPFVVVVTINLVLILSFVVVITTSLVLYSIIDMAFLVVQLLTNQQNIWDKKKSKSFIMISVLKFLTPLKFQFQFLSKFHIRCLLRCLLKSYMR